MEGSDPRRNAAITYAVLSLLVRLIASQSSVFNLWFSRRCYERSRGEMITMLYEKTLSRKAIGTPTKPQEAISPNGMNNGGPPETKQPRSQLESVSESLYRAIEKLFSATNEHPVVSKKPASMGKILNMMRHASPAVLFVVSRLTWRSVTTSTK